MRISTGQIYQRALNNILNQSAQVSLWQDQLSTEKRVQVASDDPIAAAKINLMRQRISATEQLDKNRQNAQGMLGLEENMLSQTVVLTQRLRELQIGAANSPLSEADRKSTSLEVQQLLNQLQQLANSQDNEGNYLFSGSQVLAQPITRLFNGQYLYNGDDTQRFQAVSSGSLLAINDSGKNIYMKIPSGNKDFAVKELPPGNTGSVSLSTGSVSNRAAYIADNYTISFALNSTNQMVVMVSGAVSGNVIPATGLPDDAPLYQPDASITFNGIEITAAGDPVAGDSFSIKPSQSESIFSTVQRMFDNLNQPFSQPSERARTVTENNQILVQLDSAIENFSHYLSEIGSRLNQLDVAEQSNTDLLITSKAILQQAEGIDYAEVITKFNLQIVSLQAAQQSFVKIQGLSAFNYM
jgi:flagellar hook-associated protein 3 FlgL